jgi:hypothetical protein
LIKLRFKRKFRLKRFHKIDSSPKKKNHAAGNSSSSNEDADDVDDAPRLRKKRKSRVKAQTKTLIRCQSLLD